MASLGRVFGEGCVIHFRPRCGRKIGGELLFIYTRHRTRPHFVADRQSRRTLFTRRDEHSGRPHKGFFSEGISRQITASPSRQRDAPFGRLSHVVVCSPSSANISEAHTLRSQSEGAEDSRAAHVSVVCCRLQQTTVVWPRALNCENDCRRHRTVDRIASSLSLCAAGSPDFHLHAGPPLRRRDCGTTPRCPESEPGFTFSIN